MDSTLTGRVSIVALGDVERFLESAQHLKALTLQLHALRCRDSRREAALEQQINTFTQHCGVLAAASARLAELWTQTQEELHATVPGILTPAGGTISGANPVQAGHASQSPSMRDPCSRGRPPGPAAGGDSSRECAGQRSVGSRGGSRSGDGGS